jgi:hypothetical protein
MTLEAPYHYDPAPVCSHDRLENSKTEWDQLMWLELFWSWYDMCLICTMFWERGLLHLWALEETYCDMHAVGQQSTVETLFITVAKQRNNGKNCCFLRGLVRHNNVEVFSLGSGPEAIRHWNKPPVDRTESPIISWLDSTWLPSWTDNSGTTWSASLLNSHVTENSDFLPRLEIGWEDSEPWGYNWAAWAGCHWILQILRAALSHLSWVEFSLSFVHCPPNIWTNQVHRSYLDEQSRAAHATPHLSASVSGRKTSGPSRETTF